MKMHKGKGSNNSTVENVNNAKDVVYATNITVGGKEFPIQLDTGSSDLWIKPPFNVTFTNQTNIQANLTFGIGAVSGNIAFADVSLGPYHVNSQALVNATTATDFGAIFNNGIFGIMGLAFDQASTVFVETLLSFGRNNTQGRTFLGNIFAQNTSAPNLFTVLLGRTDDPNGDQEGVFTIGEYEPVFKNITSQPKLNRTPAQLVNITTEPRWSIQMDKMVVNRKEFKFNKSNVAEAAAGKTVMVLDTGFTFSQFPPAAVDFIYSSIEGSKFNKTSGLWEVPCENTTNLEFDFGGKKFPIHPLDITVVKNVGNKTVCQNTFRNLNLPASALGSDIGFDAIMGVPFLKNVYASFDFGDVGKDNKTLGVPFVQMLSTTPDAAEALREFNKVRPKQVAYAEKLASSGATGAISFNDDAVLNSLSLGSTFSSEVPLVKRAIRMVVSGHFPIHRLVPQRVRHCIHSAARSRPVVLALLAGAIFLSLSSCVIGVILAVRMYMRSRASEEDGYEPIFDADDGTTNENDDYERSIYD
ncbi:unnamed protein product [Somion occarium]